LRAEWRGKEEKMKKKYLLIYVGVIILGIVFALFIIGTKTEDKGISPQSADSKKNITYVFPSELCEMFFGGDSEDSMMVLENAGHLPVKSVYTDKNHDLVVVLCPENFENVKHMIINLLKT
jgi:hypothetical protein